MIVDSRDNNKKFPEMEKKFWGKYGAPNYLTPQDKFSSSFENGEMGRSLNASSKLRAGTGLMKAASAEKMIVK